MKMHRIYAITLRYFYLFRHSLDRASDVFYWPTVDLLVWGLTSRYFTTFAPNASRIILIILSGLIFWIIVWRGQYEISVNLLEDLWNKNLINMFTSPLKFSEWIVALILQGIMKAIISLSFVIMMTYILYKVKILFFGLYIVPFFVLLIMFGWTIGFLVAGVILRFGTKVQNLAWSAAWIVGPFSAIYYPVSTLPSWAQKIAALVPTSYIFEGIREVINEGNLDLNKLVISFFLNSVYFVITIIFLRRSFDKVLAKGLVKVI